MDRPENLSLRDKIEWIIKELRKLRRGGGGSSSETDPIFTASPAGSITNTDINNWNNKLDAETNPGLSAVAYNNDYNSLSNKPDLSLKADLENGKIPASQLPAYVDDVLEFANLASFPATGESGKIYIAIDTNITYRWTGTGYAEISASLALGETSSTAYRGDRGKIAYDHSQATGNPHNTTKADIGLGNVDNTSDLNKPISTATQQALNNKLDKGTYTGTASDLNSKIDENKNLIKSLNYKDVTNNTIYGTSFVNSSNYVTESGWVEFIPCQKEGYLKNISFTVYSGISFNLDIIIIDSNKIVKSKHTITVSNNTTDVSSMNIPIAIGDYVGVYSTSLPSNLQYLMTSGGGLARITTPINIGNVITPSNSTTNWRLNYQFTVTCYTSVRQNLRVLNEYDYEGLGDSITNGYGGVGGNTSYADYFNATLLFKSFTKRAINSTSIVKNGTNPQLIDQINSIPSGKKGLITIMIGVNDCGNSTTLGDVNAVKAKSYNSLNVNASFAEGFRYSLENLQKKCPDATIIVILPLYSYHDSTAKLETYREVERQICDYLSIPFIELHKRCGLGINNISEFYVDGLHPNSNGYAKIAKALVSAINIFI